MLWRRLRPALSHAPTRPSAPRFTIGIVAIATLMSCLPAATAQTKLDEVAQLKKDLAVLQIEVKSLKAGLVALSGNKATLQRTKDGIILQPLDAIVEIDDNGRIVSLTLEKIRIGADGPSVDLSCLEGHTRLRDITLQLPVMTNGAIRAIAQAGFSNIESLSLWQSDVTDGTLRELATFPKLKRLSLVATGATDAGLSSLKVLKDLEQIELRRNEGITGAGLSHLESLQNLRKVELEGGFTDAALAALSKYPELTHLTVALAKVTDEGLAQIRELTGLTHLDLHINHHITDSGLTHLKRLTRLKLLDLRYTEVTDEGVASLETLTGLQELMLDGTAVTEGGIKRIQIALPTTKIIK